MTLYEINEELLKLIDPETGEVMDIELFDALNLEQTNKLESIGLWIKNLDAEVKALKEEEASLKKRREVKENRMARLKDYLSTWLDGSKFETAKVAVSFRKSVSVEIDDMNAIPAEYVNAETVYKADKKLIKKAIEDGTLTAGAHLVEKSNINIR